MKDFLIVGAGLYGSVMAHELTRKGYGCIVIDKRGASGGNIRTSMREGIMVHEYGAHIFHTSDEEVWRFVTDLVPMSPFVHSPVACFKGSFYSLPFNMHTFKALFGTSEPEEARARIEREASEEKERIIRERGSEEVFRPANLEEQALTTVGRTVYETLIKGYTAKQWGCDPRMLSADIIKRIPVRYTYEEDYFNDRYEGLPSTEAGGYTGLIDRLLEGSELRLDTDYLELRGQHEPDTWYTDPGLGLAKKVIYTGAVDEFFCNCYGPLAYRSLRFEQEELDKDDFQGHAVVNYTDAETPYTRIIEHKHLTADYRPASNPFTVITKEYPKLFEEGDERFYPVRDNASMERYNKYMELAAKCPSVTFGGRLGSYMYLDMDKVIKAALEASEKF
ncbi:MAG: UDP-galactopyranose mutase [Lachnospiraceae bacterium]|nr:UDP-galactopyranose mutase [Lachnospiraceae bacterium]MBR5016023.1 UDP-galactopyranose mutase [Clostridia bacterium]